MSDTLTLMCDLRIKAGNLSIAFRQLMISSWGASHLPASGKKIGLSPGQRVEAEISLPDLPGAQLSVPGRVFRELTRTEDHLGLVFDWADLSMARELFERWTDKWGKPVVPNRRKHPRLANPDHPKFPKFATVSKANESVFAAEGPEYEPWLAEVANLSVEGVLLSSANPLTAGIKPGDGLNILLETRETPGIRIETVAGVRRITEAVDPLRNQLVRSFGLRFEWLDDEQRTIYQALIQSICTD